MLHSLGRLEGTPENERPPCTRTLETTMGIPCGHRVLELRASGSMELSMTHFHPQHYLQANDDGAEQPTDPILTVGDPVRVRGRGRPAGGSNRIRADQRSTRREPSRFEHQLGEGRPRRGRPRRA